MSQSVPFQVCFPKNNIIFSGKHTLKIQLGAILRQPRFIYGGALLDVHEGLEN